MNDFDITLDIMEKESMGEEYKWRLQTKVTEETHDAVLEFANKYTRGNISGAVRYMIGHHIEEHGGVYISPAQHAWLKVRKQQRIVKSKLEKIHSVHLAAIELKRNPNPNYEQAVETLANELGMTWPIPEGELPAESLVNPDLRYITSHLEELWSGNGDSTTFRDLQRKTKRKAEQLREPLDTLISEGIIQCVSSDRGKIVITPL